MNDCGDRPNFGPPPWGRGRRGGGRGGLPPFPPGPPFGFGFGWGGGGDFFGRGHRGPKAGRGDVRAAALALIAEEPRNGYQIIQEIERRSHGVWRPSSGSVYPALSQLEDEGLIRAEQTEGRKSYHLTPEGEDYVASHADELEEPWATVAGPAGDWMRDVRATMGRVGMAFMQVAQAGNSEQLAAARDVLADAATRLYRILAGDLPTEGSSGPGGTDESNPE